MWYFVVGNVLSLFTYFLYSNYLNNVKGICAVDIFLGWFLFEHVFEEYDTTAGKLFLNYEDFRTLIKNVLFLVRNLVFMAQILTPDEFIFINVVLFFVIIKYRQKMKSDIFKISVILIYVFILNSFLFVDLRYVFIILKHVFVFYLLLINLILYFGIIYFIIFLKIPCITIYHFNFKVCLIKIMSYFLITFVIIFLIIVYLIKYINSGENFIQEFILNNIILYVYFFVCLTI